MKQGLIATCHNSDFNYLLIAKRFAKQSEILKLPFCLVSDSKTLKSFQGETFWDILIEVEGPKDNFRKFQAKSLVNSINFLNSSRIDTYFLSPFEKTLSIDLDYWVQNTSLLACFDSGQKLLCNSESFDLNFNCETTKFSQFDLPQFWTTVMYFEKCESNDRFFNLCSFIKENWDYYVAKFQIKSKLFRNDYAFALACHYFGISNINLPCAQINTKEDTDFDIVSNGIKINDFLYTENIHLMNKYRLQELCKEEY
jgi:hypothetical protein